MNYGSLTDRLAVLIEQMQDADRQQQELIDGMLTTTRQHLDRMTSITEGDESDGIQAAIDLLITNGYQVIKPG